VRKVSVATH
jgi:2-C-methyl-D-erythritol 4-phosphate cytidylyltransferase